MASSSKQCAKVISRTASRIYFILIILQFPFFRFPCRNGMCTTPIEVASSHLIASKVFPAAVVKPLLYPGAIAHAIAENTAVPSYQSLLESYQLSLADDFDSADDLLHLEVLVGSYMSVGGAMVGVWRRSSSGRMGMFGLLLILWGVGKEAMYAKHDGGGIKGHTHTNNHPSIHIYPAISIIALVSAFLSITRDVRKIIRALKANCLWNNWTSSSSSSSKAKYY